MPLNDEQRRFLEAKRFAVLGTVDRSGSPHLTIIWYLLDGDEILFNTKAGRAKHRNLDRDPRVSLLVYEEGGYAYVRIDGTVRPITDQATAQADIRRLALRYYRGVAEGHTPSGTPQDRRSEEYEDEAHVERAMRERFGTQERISYRLRTDRIHDYRD